MTNQIVVNGVKYVAEQAIDPQPYVIVRSRDAGVFFGKLKSRNGDTVTLNTSRRLWYWSGAATLSELSLTGVKNPDECKFPAAIYDHEIFGVCEILQATEAAVKSIAGVKVWKA